MGETMTDPFTQIPLPDDKGTLLKLSFLAALARENEIHFRVVGGWVLPLASLPWCPRKARALRVALYHAERCRGVLQAHAAAFPAMSRTEAEAWVADMRRHHGKGACWWSPSVAGIAWSICNMVEA